MSLSYGLFLLSLRLTSSNFISCFRRNDLNEGFTTTCYSAPDAESHL